jgi:hypothetical protein
MLRAALLLAAIQLSPADGAPIPGASALSSHADSATVYDGAARELDVVVPRIGRVDISIDGRLDEAAWLDAAVLTGFTQYSPIEGSSASENTTVRVIITDDAFLFAIRADDRSGGVRATLTERDGYGRSDDYVRVVLDTFNDQRRAYVFMVNPLGVQADGLWVAGGSGRFGDPIDWSPDFLWQSSGRVDDEGFSAEIRIPIKSLRFPELEVQDWGLQIQRTIRRTGYSQSWAPITSERANSLEQSGSIRGLEGLDPGLFLEINPTLVGSSQSRANEFDRLVRDGAEYEMGLNLTYGLTSNLTLDGTVNPDFSQIEADAGQIAINERFALFLPEQRPFFLEGTDVFSMPKRLVYTRSIVNPIGAAKLSGKVGSFNVAYLGAVDKLDGGASQPIVNLLRFKRDLGRSSSIGGVYTDRTEPGAGYNRVLGADARLVLGGRYTLEMLAAGSADGSPGSSTDWGSLFSLSARRSGRALSMNASFEDVTADFQAGSGFIRRTGITQVDGRTSYTFRGDRGSLVESWGPSVDASATWDQGRFWSAGTPLETRAGVGLSTSLRGNVGGFLNYRQSSYAFDATYYDGLYSGPSEGDLVPVSSSQDLFSNLHSLSLRGWVSTWDAVRISFGAGWSESPIFSRSVPLGLGERWSTDVGFTVYPTGSIQAEIGARHVTILRSLDESKYSSATIPRLQIRYQLSRALYVRSIGEYSTQSRGDLLDPVTGEAVYSCNGGTCAVRRGSDAHDFRIEGLLGYEPTPGTVLFFGYTRQFEDTSAFTFERVRSVADGLFLKLSYRFRK